MPVVLWWIFGGFAVVFLSLLLLGLLGVMNLSYPPTDNPRCYCPDCGADLGNFFSNRIRMVRRGGKVKTISKEDQAVVTQFQEYLRDLHNSEINDEVFADKWHEYMDVDKSMAVEHRRSARAGHEI